MGFATVIDSLAAIKKTVFEDKTLTLAALAGLMNNLALTVAVGTLGRCLHNTESCALLAHYSSGAAAVGADLCSCALGTA